MPFLLLLLLIVVYLPGKWPGPPTWLGGWGSALATWLAAALMCGLAGLLAGRVRRQLGERGEQRSQVIRRYASWRKYHLLFHLTVYLTALFALGWGGTVRSWGTSGSRVIPGLEVLTLAPFLTVLILGWAFFYRVEREIHESGAGSTERTFPSRPAYLSMQIRHNFLLVFPPLLMMLVQQVLLWVWPELGTHWVFGLVLLGMLVALFLTLPWMLVLLLGLKPLPSGPLRQRLLAAAERLGLRCRDILLWNTRRGIANALVTGILPRLRYVVVSDRLVSDLTPDEVEAVFGHEAGHVKHHHLLYYLVFILVSMVAVGSLWEAIAEPSAASAAAGGGALASPAGTEEGPEDILATLPLLGLLTAHIFVVFGFLSRRCERQADIFGCRTVSCADPSCSGHDANTVLVPQGRGLCATGINIFVGALEKVADVNGISRTRPGLLSSWQHSTIARRVEFLQGMQSDPALEPRFQRRVGLVKWGLLLGLSAVMAALLAVVASNGGGLDRVLGSLIRF
jgi:Zn-dependent protease with chaperone function